MIKSSQHGFAKGKSGLTNLGAFYNDVTILLDEGRPAGVDYLDFSKSFDTVCNNILIDKLTKYKLSKCTVSWRENQLNSWAQSVVVSGVKSTQKPVTTATPRH